MHFIKIEFFFFSRRFICILMWYASEMLPHIYTVCVCVCVNQNWSLCWEEMVAIGGPLRVSVQTSEKQILSLKTNTVVFLYTYI